MNTLAHEAPSRAYSVAEVAERTSLGQSTIRKLIAAGELAVHRIGRRVLVPEDALARLVAGQA